MFAFASGIVSFSSDRPGNYATMFGPGGEKLDYRSDASHFDDKARQYTWSFGYGGEVKDGDLFVFATRDREVVGEVDGTSVRSTVRKMIVSRDGRGEPFAVREHLPQNTARDRTKIPTKFRNGGARILAIFPGVQSPGAGWGSLSHQSANNESAYMAHGMSYVSAYLKHRGHTVWLLDTRAMSGWAQFVDVVRSQDYDFAMLGPLSIEAFTAACIVRVLKEIHPDKPVILGGLHVSMTKDKVFPPDDLPKYYLYGEPPSRMREFLNYKGEPAFDKDRWPKADYVVWNEGELVTASIVEGENLQTGDWDYEETGDGTVFLNGKIVPDLNKMPHMDRSLFNEDMEKQHPLLPELPAPFHTITFGRGCPYKCSYSVTGDTIVFMDAGPVEIEKLASGVGLVRTCVHGGEMVEYRVDQKVASPSGRSISTIALDEGVQPIVRVEAEGGLSIKATPTHKFLCVAGDDTAWKTVAEMTVGDFMVVRQPEREWSTTYQRLTPPILKDTYKQRGRKAKVHKCPEVLDEKLAWLVGFMIGDGCIPTDNRAALHICVTPDVEQKQREIVRELFGVELKTYSMKHTSKMLHGWIHSRLAREILVQSIGIDPNDKLKIPNIFWKAPKTVLAAFIDGLFDADGYFPDKAASFLTTISKRLAHEVGYALLMLGRGCPNIQFVEGASGYSTGNHYRVGVLLNDRIPGTRGIYRSTKSGLWYWRTKKGANQEGIRRRTLRESGLNHPLDRDGWYYVRVEAITQCLPERVYDISVPGDEAFVANGFVAHNCSVGEQFASTKVRLIDPDYFMEELHELKRRNGGVVGSMMIHDDILLFPTWLEKWNEKIKQQFGHIVYWCQMRADFIVRNPKLIQHMAEAGMVWVSVGYEVGYARGLNETMNKDLKVVGMDDPVEINIKASEILTSLNINSFGNFMFGNPTESNEEMDATVRMIQRIQPQHHGFSTYCDYPGTPMSRMITNLDLRANEWYATSHYPWQYRVKGVDYGHVDKCIKLAAQTPKKYMNPGQKGMWVR